MNLFTPDGREIEPRAKLPTGDLRLPDGRDLRVRGHIPMPHGQGTVWQCANGLRVIGSMDPTPHGLLMHVSVSYPNRDPPWEDIKDVRYLFFPDTIDTMMVLPKKADYVNVMQHCFHIWQTPTAWNVL